MSTIQRPDNSSTYKIIGAVSLAVAIASFFFSLLPCIGSLAVVTSALALIGSGISYSKIDPANKERGVSLAAIIISIVALLISGGQALFIGSAASEWESLDIDTQQWQDQMDQGADEDPYEIIPELLDDSTLRAIDSIMESELDTTDIR